MKQIKTFTKTSFLSGLAVLLPVAIFLFLFNWVFQFVTDLIQPLTDIIVGQSNVIEILADGIVLISLLLICFAVGALVKTQLGDFLHRHLELSIFNVAPGYSTIKDIVNQFFGTKKSPFASVALARIFGNDTMVTVFITDEHPNGMVTVFMPTGPNPTSGNIYHLKEEYIHRIEASVEETMRSIISCGAGSTKLIEAYIANENKGNLEEKT